MVITGDDVAHAKPHPAVFPKAALQLGIDPSKLVAFEDAVSGVKAAGSAGMKVYWHLLSMTSSQFCWLRAQTMYFQISAPCRVRNFGSSRRMARRQGPCLFKLIPTLHRANVRIPPVTPHCSISKRYVP